MFQPQIRPIELSYLIQSSFLSFQVKIWFQNRRTKWKKQDNISNSEAAEHKNTVSSKGGRENNNNTKSNCTSSPPPDSPVPSQHLHHLHSTPLVNGPSINGHHSHFVAGPEKSAMKHHHHHSPSSSSTSSKYKQKLSREEALYKAQSPAAAAYLPHHNPLFSMIGHHPHGLGMDHHHSHHGGNNNDVEARLAASKISISAFNKVGDSNGLELSPMLSIGAMGRLPRS